MADDIVVELPEDVTVLPVESDIQVRDASKREIEVRLLPWGHTIETTSGPEEFARGATLGTASDGVLLMGLEHEAHMGLGQNGQPVLTRRPAGRSTAVWEADDGPHVAFRVARTQAGDEILALAEDKIVRGVSVEFKEVPGGTSTVMRNGRRVRVHNRIALTGASMTYRPAYGEQAAVVAVRSQAEEAPVAENESAGAPATEPAAPVLDLTPFNAAVASMGETMARSLDGFAGRLEKIEEQTRSQITFPARHDEKESVSRGTWLKTVLKVLSGETVPDQQMRVMADLVTTDNLGVVPEAFSSELIGVIDPSRPFLQSTTRVPTPDSGMTLNMPVLTTRPTAGVQVNEKDDIVSTATSITSTGFDALTIAGGGDISLQLLKRSSPSYLDLYLRLLAEALAQNSEAEAIAALLASSVTPGTGPLDPEALTIGEAWANAQAVRQRADRIWLSSDAVAEFIDAKVNGTNAPLYANIAAEFNVANGTQNGTVSGLRPVYVPALDGTGVDVVVGPSRGFAWAEDGAFTLQVDVPSKAGRDVALVVIDWFAPLYPAAFTTYAL